MTHSKLETITIGHAQRYVSPSPLSSREGRTRQRPVRGERPGKPMGVVFSATLVPRFDRLGRMAQRTVSSTGLQQTVEPQNDSKPGD